MEPIKIEKIRTLCKAGTLRWTKHILTRLLQRGIGTQDVINALENGDIIEQYPDDYPYPSCLVLGFTANEIPVHVVCGASETELWLITVYIPNPMEWSADFRTRKEHF